jgi:hypothetical protein
VVELGCEPGAAAAEGVARAPAARVAAEGEDLEGLEAAPFHVARCALRPAPRALWVWCGRPGSADSGSVCASLCSSSSSAARRGDTRYAARAFGGVDAAAPKVTLELSALLALALAVAVAVAVGSGGSALTLAGAEGAGASALAEADGDMCGRDALRCSASRELGRERRPFSSPALALPLAPPLALPPAVLSCWAEEEVRMEEVVDAAPPLPGVDGAAPAPIPHHSAPPALALALALALAPERLAPAPSSSSKPLSSSSSLRYAAIEEADGERAPYSTPPLAAVWGAALLCAAAAPERDPNKPDNI